MHDFARNPFVVRPLVFAAPDLVRQRHVSDNSISIEEMAFHQKRNAEVDIRELIWVCRERYCFAHELLRPHAVLPDRLFDRGMLDLGDFYLPWSEFCSAYRRALFDPQMSLLEDQRTRELRRWSAFLQKECLTRFTRDPEWVRAVLETANLIPPRGPNRELFVGDLFDDIIQDISERKGHDYDRQA